MGRDTENAMTGTGLKKVSLQEGDKISNLSES